VVGIMAIEIKKAEDQFFVLPTCHYQVLEDVSSLEGGMDAYEISINQIILAPNSVLPIEVKNDPLKLRLEANLDSSIKDARSCFSEDMSIIEDLELIKKGLFDVEGSAAELVEAFSMAGPRGNVNIDIEDFSSRIQESQRSIAANIQKIKDKLHSSLPQDNKQSSLTGVRMFLLVLIMLFIVYGFIVLSKSYRVSRYLLRLNGAIFRMRDNDFSSKEISTELNPVNDSELFELYDAVSSTAIKMDTELMDAKKNLDVLGDELSRYKAVSKYMTDIMNSLHDGIMITNDILKVSFVNLAFEKMWRVKRTTLLDKDAKELALINSVKGWKEALSKTLYAGVNSAKVVSIDVESKGSDKSSNKKLKMYIMPLKDLNAKEVTGTITIIKLA
jgi:PAS domain-containing protein